MAFPVWMHQGEQGPGEVVGAVQVDFHQRFQGTVGLVAGALVHFVVQPLSKAQFLISILGFAVLGFLASAADSAPPAVRARLAAAFTSRPYTRRELLLWFVVIAVAVLGLLLGGNRVS